MMRCAGHAVLLSNPVRFMVTAFLGLLLWVPPAIADPLCHALHDAEAVATLSDADKVPADLPQRLRGTSAGGRFAREVDALANAIELHRAIGGDVALISLRLSLDRLRGAWPQCFLSVDELTYEGASDRSWLADTGTPDDTAQSMGASRSTVSRVSTTVPRWITIEIGLILLCVALLVVVVRRQPRARRSARYLCDVPTRIKGAYECVGSMVNISTGGAQLLVSGHEFKVGESVDISCDALKATAKVRWVNLHFVGVQFAKKITHQDVRAVASAKA